MRNYRFLIFICLYFVGFVYLFIDQKISAHSILIQSVYTYLAGFFYASNSVTEEESILAMTTNPDDSLLITGDTMGHVYIWDIKNYCLEPTDKVRARQKEQQKDY